MLNCYNCIYLDAENHFCKRRVHNVPGICPYAEERKPRNNFEMLKSMSMEEMAVWVASIGPMPEVMLKFWQEWLKEEITDA